MNVPAASQNYGLVPEGLGAHSSRTMMLEELSLLFNAVPADADYMAYQSAVMNDNVLLKATASTRARSFRYLRELYGLKSRFVLFRALRELWPFAVETKPLLALLCAVARDPLLRSTVGLVTETLEGETLTNVDFSNAVQEQFRDRLNPPVLGKVGRNTASTWTQSGHLAGARKKVRQPVQSDTVATTYALLLAFLCGYRGESLFTNDWLRLLDTPVHSLQTQAQQAAQQGWLEYRQSGNITEITFRHFLKDD